MARSVKDKKLDSRTARNKLKVQREPHWRLIENGFHIGYRKHKNGGGSWIARARLEDKKYHYSKIGKADDIQDSDGIAILSFSDAQKSARKWYELTKRHELGGGSRRITINQILDDYLEYLKDHGKSYNRSVYSINAYIRPHFGDLLATKLTSKQIAEWHKNLARTPPRQRSKPGSITYKETNTTKTDYTRKRKNSANRILTILKAALNRAYYDGKIITDDAWRRVKPFKNVDSAKIRFLRTHECIELMNACTHDFRKLVQAGLLTGCRYGELCNLRTADFNKETGTLFIGETKNGRPRYVTLDKQGIDFFTHLTKEKEAKSLILTHENGSKWGKSHQTRRLRDACKKAHIAPAINFHILRHTHASQLALKGTPMAVIAAQLGHADTRVCEKHYAHITPNYIAETIRANFPDFGIIKEGETTK